MTLCEKSGELGGILKCEQAIPFKREMYELGLSLARQMKQEGVTVRLNTEVTPEYVEQETPDALIVAVGSEPFVPELPGIDGENVVIVNDYYLKSEKIKDTVVVLGGGMSGCECAVHLAQEGKAVHLVGRRDVLAGDANVRHRPALLRELEKQGVLLHVGCAGKRITAEGVICSDHDGNAFLVPGESVVCALGQRSRREAADSLLDSAPIVRLIGDCVRPGNITTAVYQGHHAAMDHASMQVTNRAMLSRAQAGIRKGTLIINLPGSPKAAKENLEAVLPAIGHGLEMLSGRPADCAKLID